MRKVGKRILKIFAWIIASILLLLLLVFILIQVPAVQRFAKNKAVAYLQDKIKTKVSIGELSIKFPKQIVLKDVYVEDQHKDTLLYAHELRVDISLLKLITKKIDVQYVLLNTLNTNIYRNNPDTTFNYDYIVKAFASKDTTKSTDTSSSGFTFQLGKIELQHINARFKDDATGNDVHFYLGDFSANIQKFDPSKAVYKIKEILVDSIATNVHQYKPTVIVYSPPKVAASSSTSPAIDLGLDNLTLSHINAGYANDANHLKATILFEEFIAQPDKIDLAKTNVTLKNISLKNAQATILFDKTPPSGKKKVVEKVNEVKDTVKAMGWSVLMKQVGFDNINFSYDDNNAAKAKKGMDYSHLHIQQFVLRGKDVNVTSDGYNGNIQQLSFKEQSGFDLRKLQTQFAYNDKGASLNNLLLQTDKTTIQNRIAIKYPSISSLSKQLGNLFIDANLKNSSIAVKDILTFAPMLDSTFKGNENAVIKLNTSIKGYLKDIKIPVFEVSGIGNTSATISGSISGLPNASKTYYDLNITKLVTTRKDLLHFIPKNTIPSNIRIPESLIATGSFKGSIKDFITQLKLHTTNGDANIKGYLHGESYDADIALNNLDVGYITSEDSTIGKVTMLAKAKGNGFDMKKANAVADVNIISAEFKGYEYKNLVMHAIVDTGNADVKANIKDENIAFDMHAIADLKNKYPALQLNLLLDTLNMRALHLMKDTLALHANIVANMPVTNPDSLVGTITIDDVNATTTKQTYHTDTLQLTATANGAEKELRLNTEMLQADVNGEYKLTELPQAIKQTLHKYYAIANYKDTTINNQKLNMHAVFVTSPLVLQFMPDLKGTDSVVLNATYNSAANDIDATIKSQRIVYGSTQLDSLNVIAKTDTGKLNLDASLRGVTSGSNIKLYRTDISGAIANSKINVNLNVKDSKNKDEYNVGAFVAQIEDGIKFSLEPNSLLLDYDKWKVSDGNFIQYDSAGLLVHEFYISHDDESLKINSTAQSADAPVDVVFEHFKISTVTKIVNQSSLLLDGTINGKAEIKTPTTNPIITSDINIENIIYKKDSLGNIALKVNNEQANIFAADIAITGNKNDVKLNGNYYTGDSRFDMKLNIGRLNLSTAKPFITDYVKDIGGYLKGNLAIQGSMQKPVIAGHIHFDSSFIVPSISGEIVKLSNDDIEFDSDGFNFSEFAMLDSANDKATLDGNVFTNDYRNYKFDLSFNAQNFRLVNSTPSANQIFYGKLNIDAAIDLTGDMDSPSANAYLRVNKQTDFTLILPSDDPEIEDRKGVVRFVSKNRTDSVRLQTILDSLSRNSELKGLDVSVDVEVDSSAQFTLVIDERNGDALTLRGRANLSGGIDKSGKTSLTGNYELEAGAYNLSLSLLKRKFLIQRGSTIMWTGDPTSAQIDITASYPANTAPINLVIDQLAGMQQSEINKYNEKLPFAVNLHMVGDLLKPVITFDITLPDLILSQWPYVDLRLQQMRTDQSELNKQVFALLLLNTFVEQNPLQSASAGTTASALARQSASAILTDQLNQLAGSLIKGVDLNFGVTSETDYTTGAPQDRTDLTVGVSKKLLNDRLRVNVGSSFLVGGTANPGENTSNIAGNISVDYQLSRDGRYMVRVYSKNEYESVIEGQVTETGVSFILTFDYDRFKELFEKTKKEEIHTNTKHKKGTTTPPPADQTPTRGTTPGNPYHQ